MSTHVKPICFMVMPFGTKPTEAAAGRGPAKVNFDLLWTKLFKPLIEDLGYEPVRADADLGASIIADMIERLTLSDLVLADVSIPNVNVFYEVGVRHAARATGCALVAASWSKQPFDTQSMRYEPYELAAEVMGDDEAKQNRERLRPRVERLASSKTPCYEMAGFPDLPRERAQSFRGWLRRMSDVNARITAIRLEPPSSEREARARALVNEHTAGGPISLVVAYELLKLLNDVVGWKEAVAFIDALPDTLREIPLFVEQRALGVSKSGDHFQSIAALEQLIELEGPTPERHGLIGGRYKKLWRETRATDERQAARYLDKAIDAYEAGRLLDLNSYYASSNLPRLLRQRGADGDSERAARIAVSVVAACERAIKLNRADEWVYPTLLAAAFDAADVAKATEFIRDVQRAPADWKLDSVLADLSDSLKLQPAGPVRDRLMDLEAILRPRDRSLS